jgi:bleomycin hydrolase
MRRIYRLVDIVLALWLINPVLLQGQSSGKGEISTEILNQIRNSLLLDGPTRAMINAVSNNDIKGLALNRDVAGKTDHFFAHKIETEGITNQKSTGRCWLFTSLNVLRPKVIEKYNLKEFEFSENYSFFWDQFEKANLFLEGIIATLDQKIDDREVEWLFKYPIQDGGIWNYAVDLIAKYGLVPKEVMPETHNSENTGMMSRLMRRKLREQGMQLRKLHQEGKKLEMLRDEKLKMLSDIYRMLVINLGVPPTEFTWRYEDKEGKLSESQQYTPQAFYQEIVGIDLNEYVQLMNDPSKPYYRLYQIKYDRNMIDRPDWIFVNLPTDELKQFAKTSIVEDEALYFACDVGKQLEGDEGVLRVGIYDYESIYGVKFGMTKAERVLTFESGSTHGMALVGVDTTTDGKTTKWLLENSWGKDRGHNGFLTMTDEWFDEYMFRLVVHKKFVSDKVLDIFKQKPIILPPWDQMFLPVDY